MTMVSEQKLDESNRIHLLLGSQYRIVRGEGRLNFVEGHIVRYSVADPDGDMDAYLRRRTDGTSTRIPVSVSDNREWQFLLVCIGNLAHVFTCEVSVSPGVFANFSPSVLKPVLDRSVLDQDGQYSYDPFVYVRRQGYAVHVRSPTAQFSCQLYGSADLEVLMPGFIRGRVSSRSTSCDQLILRLLVATGFASQAVEPSVESTDSARVAEPWEFHDLVFHTASRIGRTNSPVGATRRFSPPAIVESDRTCDCSASCVTLLPHVAGSASATQSTLYDALDNRRTARAHSSNVHLDVKSLSELLYRSARTTDLYPRSEVVGSYRFERRPYPAGGALHDLCVYVVAYQCEGLQHGLYRYDGVTHKLHWIDAREDLLRALCNRARVGADMRSDPQVQLVFTSQFQKLQWKYSSISYALTLKHVGALMQTIYLVGCQLGMAVCALGSGDSDTFARAAGLRWMQEDAVGEMVVGSPVNA
jgi:SagB-type dehydrogenase family enzyme